MKRPRRVSGIPGINHVSGLSPVPGKQVQCVVCDDDPDARCEFCRGVLPTSAMTDEAVAIARSKIRAVS